jgi:D-amino peptidase
MRVYISVDMEGIGGVATLDQVIRGGHGYPRAQQLMTAEANAAIAGAFDAGADSVLVNDSHGAMDNLLHEELDPRAGLMFGAPKLDCMAEGIDAGHDVALFVGYHAAAGAPGVLAHTFSGHFLEVRLNGTAVSEADVNALQAAAVGVPVGLLTGDDVICAAAGGALPGLETVVVKRAHGYSAADSLSPAAARRQIREAAARVVANAGHLRPVDIPEVLVVEVDMPNPTAAELAAMMPGAERAADRTVGIDARTPRDILGFITVCYQLAASAMRTKLLLINRL